MSELPTNPMEVFPTIPFDYTIRDYAGIRDSMIRAVKSRIPGWDGETQPHDFVLALIEGFAYSADSMHYYLDRIANEAYIHTAVRPDSIMSMARLVGYRPSRGTAASTSLFFTNTTSESVHIPVGTRVQIASPNAGGKRPLWDAIPVVFETTDELTLIGNGSQEVGAKEGLTFSGIDGDGEMLGLSNGLPWQYFDLPHSPVEEGSVRLRVRYGTAVYTDWIPVEDVRSAGANKEVFQVQTSPNGLTRVLFGNGASGQIPPSGSAIKATYRVGGGSRGNVKADTLTLLMDSTSLIGVTVTNPRAASGGTDAEDIDSVRRKIMWRGITTPERAVSLTDFERIARNVQGVQKARAFSPNAADIVVAIAPSNDDTNTPGWSSADPHDPSDNLSLAPVPVPLPIPAAACTHDFNQSFASTNTAIDSAINRTLSVLKDASFAGSQVVVVPAKYVEIDFKIDVYTMDTFDARLEKFLKLRLLNMFAYKNVSFEQRISKADFQRELTLFGIDRIDVKVLRRTQEEEVLKPHVAGKYTKHTVRPSTGGGADQVVHRLLKWGPSSDTIQLMPDEIPFLGRPGNITDKGGEDYIKFIDPSSAPATRSAHKYLGRGGVPIGATIHSASGRFS